MRRYRLFSLVVLSTAALFGVASLRAQSFSTRPCEGNHSSGGFLGHLFSQESVCEVRSAVVPFAGGRVRVHGVNGNVEVVGEDRSDVALEARVEAHGRSVDDAQSLLHEVRILTDGTITADGPKTNDGRGWSVNFRLRVPRRLAAEVESVNGDVKLASIEGEIYARTTNGGLTLSRLAGNVHASTTNGDVSVVLDGGTWRGGGLSVRSTNGGLHIHMPDGYSAHVMARTTNGDVSGNFPNRRYGQPHNSLDTTVGQGGPTLDLGTTNGDISFTAN